MITLGALAQVVGGELRAADPSVEVRTPPFFDSRTPIAGGVFLALRGEQADGHDFARQAMQGGAVAVLATRDVDQPAIIVDDVVEALGRWAAHHRRGLTNLVTIGITGSQGKTTTKDMLAQILERVGPTVSPVGSYNNDLGAPLTLLSCTEQTRFCVVEMGARHEGDIARLASMADLDVGAVLVVGTAHLGEFGSREAIARTKGEIVRGLAADKVAVLGTFDELTPRMAEGLRARVSRFGPDGEVRAEGVQVARGFAHFALVTPEGSAPVELRMPGEHQVANALAAAACARAVEVPLVEIAAGLNAAIPRSRWRMEFRQRGDGLLVINDAYNANPESMRAALRTLAELARERGGRSIAVLGEMRELGASSAQEHDAIGRLAVRLDISRLIAVGEGAKAIHMGAAHEGSWGEESVFVESIEEATARVRREAGPQDAVLVKASRSIGLERVAAALMEEQS
jgi:UDP-N-acetylmuramoyl-tripeptide--D-alanyl-D-alanine ligase